MHRLRLPRGLLALIGISILVAALTFVGGSAVLEALKRCSPVAVAAAAASILLATMLGAWNVYRIAGLRSTMTFSKFLPVFWRSWAFGITLPGQVADMLTTLWQLKGSTGDLNFIAGRLLVDKMITLCLTMGLAVLLPWATGSATLHTSLLLFAWFAVTVTAGIVLFAWCARRFDLLFRGRWIERIQLVLSATKVPLDLALANAVLTCIKVLLSGLAYWFILMSIAATAPSFAVTTVISQSAGLIAYIPISFNGLGTVEVSAVALFRTAGLGSAVVLSTYLILRTTTLAVAWLPTAAFLLRKPIVEKKEQRR